MPDEQQQKFEAWAIVELFGHSVIAGRVTEQVIGGGAFVRVDVPEANGQAAFTKFFGAGAIYALTPTDEQTALQAVSRLQVKPVSLYVLPALAGPLWRIDEDDIEYDPDNPD